ncbi:MAG: SagB/ThcOx family dehydrogenase [Desulfobacterota bacterium]|nr:SagB/ThcOx family dehydrogenase [Thermodesulfobacteriota bacterium]
MTPQRRDIGQQYQNETKYFREQSHWRMNASTDSAYPHLSDSEASSTISVLPLPPAPQADLWEILKKRRSHRDFSLQPISFNDLCLLLFAVQGVTSTQNGYLFRTAPSAGALYPIETYVLVHRVASLRSGLYHYHVAQGYLELRRLGSFERNLASAALDQTMVADAAVSFIWTAVVHRSTRKYRERAYRYIYMDAGHIGQNLYLAATALGLGCCTIGAFYDDEINALIGVDGLSETVVYMGIVGHRLSDERLQRR